MTKAKCLEVSVIRQSFCLYVISPHPSLRLLFLISILKIPAKHKDNSKETPNKITHNTLFSFLSLFMPKFEYLVLLFILLFGLLGCFVFFFLSVTFKVFTEEVSFLTMSSWYRHKHQDKNSLERKVLLLTSSSAPGVIKPRHILVQRLNFP